MMDEFADLFADVAVDEQDLQSMSLFGMDEQDLQDISLFNDWSLLCDADEANIWYSLETTIQDLESCSDEQGAALDLPADTNIEQPTLEIQPLPVDLAVQLGNSQIEQPNVYSKIPGYFQGPVNNENKHCHQTEEIPKQETEQICKQETEEICKQALSYHDPVPIENSEIICSPAVENKSADNKLYTKIPSYITGIIGPKKSTGSMTIFPRKEVVTEYCDKKIMSESSEHCNELSSQSRMRGSGKRGRQTGFFPQGKLLRPGFQTTDCHAAKYFLSSSKPFRSKDGTLKPIEDRKIVYVGNVTEDTTTSALRQHFSQFGTVNDVSLHFREHGDNYGFVTFSDTAGAIKAIEHGNDDPRLPKFDLCFGGRRHFCKSQYADLDSLESSARQQRNKETDFDTLLKSAKMTIER